jgi:hypothetical protein
MNARTLLTAFAVVGCAAPTHGCGGSSTAPSTTPRVLQVAGQYQITQQTMTDTCGGGQPPSVSATVTHTAGTNPFSMSDSGDTTLAGTVQASGQFTATATFGPDANGQTFSQQLQGAFTTNGFNATLTVHASPRNCDFTRSWTATKQGPPNVIP